MDKILDSGSEAMGSIPIEITKGLKLKFRRNLRKWLLNKPSSLEFIQKLFYLNKIVNFI